MNEKNVRQEECNQIARDIHDSVGNRLTALLAQLEVVRLKTTDDSFLENINHLWRNFRELKEQKRYKLSIDVAAGDGFKLHLTASNV